MSVSNTVLLVDDNQHFLKPLAEYLSIDRDRYEVVTAGNGREALDILANQSIFLVVSDIKMPEITGLHLLSEIRKQYPRTDVILMTAYGTEDIRSKVKQSGCLHFLEKPFNAEDLRRLIIAQIATKDEGFAGTLKHIQLTDLIQMCCLSDVSISIRVSHHNQQGVIRIENGKVLHAECGQLAGEDAFYTILGWESGRFETLDNGIPVEATINKSSHSLLLEAARLADEKALMEDAADQQVATAPPANQASRTIRILVVDDSPVMCKVLAGLLDGEADMTVVDIAQNGEDALKKIRELKPDLITLDVNMPVMDGSTALKHIMISNPCPVVIISSLGSRSHANVLDFLRVGAVDFLQKPKQSHLSEQSKTLMLNRIRLAAKAKMTHFKRFKAPAILPQSSAVDQPTKSGKRIVVVSSGAGGYMELGGLLNALPESSDLSVVAFQTMPAEFMLPLVDYLRPRSRLAVRPFEKKTPLLGGYCYISTPESAYRISTANGEALRAEAISDSTDQPADHFDQFVASLTASGLTDIALVLLSGAEIGHLAGLRQVKEIGGTILAQDPGRCMVPHPIEAAVGAELVNITADIEDIAVKIASQDKVGPDE